MALAAALIVAVGVFTWRAGFSLPRLLGGEGILETFPLPLSPDEESALQYSAGLIRDIMDKLEGSL